MSSPQLPLFTLPAPWLTASATAWQRGDFSCWLWTRCFPAVSRYGMRWLVVIATFCTDHTQDNVCTIDCCRPHVCMCESNLPGDGFHTILMQSSCGSPGFSRKYVVVLLLLLHLCLNSLTSDATMTGESKLQPCILLLHSPHLLQLPGNITHVCHLPVCFVRSQFICALELQVVTCMVSLPWYLISCRGHLGRRFPCKSPCACKRAKVNPELLLFMPCHSVWSVRDKPICMQIFHAPFTPPCCLDSHNCACLSLAVLVLVKHDASDVKGMNSNWISASMQ